MVIYTESTILSLGIKATPNSKNTILIVQKVLTEDNIDICGVQELNLRTNDNMDTMKIPGYSIVTYNLRQSNDIARAAIIIKDGIKYITRPELSSQLEAQVAVTIQATKQISFNIHSWYRQWRQINLEGRIKDSWTTKAQKTQT